MFDVVEIIVATDVVYYINESKSKKKKCTLAIPIRSQPHRILLSRRVFRDKNRDEVVFQYLRHNVAFNDET